MSRPRLLYFNGPWDFLGQRILTSYVEPFRRLLEQDFEVVSVEGDCDLKQEVEAHAPDVILFNTGAESPLEHEVSIRNPHAYREIPRMGYVNRDPISASRLAAMNRLAKWGVDQVFTAFRISDAPGPFFADAIYVPWWIDDHVSRDYGEPKRFPITLAGAGWLINRLFYTWRFPVFRALTPKLPLFHVPAFQTHESEDAYVGERYARLLNQSQFAAGCGSINRFLTLKLLEIPGCRSCLITEETEVVKAAGFRDGVNCVFANETNVVGKVQELLDAPERLQEITDAGYRLVHERHTQRNRRMFFEWFHLWRTRATGQRIVQPDPFGPLQLIEASAPTPHGVFPDENPLLDMLNAGYERLSERRWEDAITQFDAVIQSIPYVAEARIGAAIAQFHAGNMNATLAHLAYNYKAQLEQRASAHPDIINLSYLIAILVRRGMTDTAVELLCYVKDVRHPSINALRKTLTGRRPFNKKAGPYLLGLEDGESGNIVALHHRLPARTFADWTRVWEEFAGGC